MKCDEAREYFSEYVEGIEDSARIPVEAHLRDCGKCQAEIRGLEKMLGLLRKMPEVEPPRDFLVKLNARIDEIEDVGLFSKLSKILGQKWAWSKGLAMAATVVLVFLGTFYLTDQMPGTNQNQASDNSVAMLTGGVAEESASGGEVLSVRAEAKKKDSASVMSGEEAAIRRRSLYQPPSYDGYPYEPAPATVPEGAIRPVSAGNPGAIRRNPVTDVSYTERAPATAAPSTSKAIYPDHIIILRTDNRVDAVEQIMASAAASEAEFLDYSLNVKFIMVSTIHVDHFEQALESLGSVTKFEGPLDRSEAKNFLIEVIVLSSGQ